jgi:hypothetical protein
MNAKTPKPTFKIVEPVAMHVRMVKRVTTANAKLSNASLID